MTYLDVHPDVIQWSSEEFCIPYRSPIDGRIHRYFPDFWVKKRNETGVVETVVVEVKPKNQVLKPTLQTNKRTKKPTKRYLQEVMTYGINEAKWKAAEAFCAERKWKFKIMTEIELNIK